MCLIITRCCTPELDVLPSVKSTNFPSMILPKTLRAWRDREQVLPSGSELPGPDLYGSAFSFQPYFSEEERREVKSMVPLQLPLNESKWLKWSPITQITALNNKNV